MARLGVVSFLNARPLIEGLEAEAGVELQCAVPSALPAMLRRGEVDAALIPVIDLARASEVWERISDAGIVSAGETLTVRVFSRIPPEAMTVLHADPDSHTSVALARLIWRHRYGRRLRIEPLAAANEPGACESVLLIGDKVVTAPARGYKHQIDLGEAWQKWQQVPFVFAAWSAPAGGDHTALAALLNQARDRGVARAAEVAATWGPKLGWPVGLATGYLTRHLSYTVTPEAAEGMQRFFELAAAEGLVPDAGAAVP